MIIINFVRQNYLENAFQTKIYFLQETYAQKLHFNFQIQLTFKNLPQLLHPLNLVLNFCIQLTADSKNAKHSD